ncbi:MAG: hypothetical protein ACKO7P_02875 [Bacteroidota bacterium]
MNIKTYIVFALTCFALSFLSRAQVYTISVSSYQLFAKKGVVDFQEALASAEEISSLKEAHTKHILDFEKNICSYYFFDNYVNTVAIVNREKKDNLEIITLQDYDSEGSPVLAYFVIDSERNQLFYYWHNAIQNVTKVESKKEFILEKS